MLSTSPGRPIFLKMVYHGPKAMEELAYNPHLVPGILGGSAGTTYDAFKLLAKAKKYGAKAALYGRKINKHRTPTGLHSVPAMDRRRRDRPRGNRAGVSRHVAGLGHKARAPLDKDMQLTSGIDSYGGAGRTISHRKNRDWKKKGPSWCPSSARRLRATPPPRAARHRDRDARDLARRIHPSVPPGRGIGTPDGRGRWPPARRPAIGGAACSARAISALQPLAVRPQVILPPSIQGA